MVNFERLRHRRLPPKWNGGRGGYKSYPERSPTVVQQISRDFKEVPPREIIKTSLEKGGNRNPSYDISLCTSDALKKKSRKTHRNTQRMKNREIHRNKKTGPIHHMSLFWLSTHVATNIAMFFVQEAPKCWQKSSQKWLQLRLKKEKPNLRFVIPIF